jgi:hypothetical protein
MVSRLPLGDGPADVGFGWEPPKIGPTGEPESRLEGRVMSNESNRGNGRRQEQARETCQMCQGTGLMAFVLPNLLHEEITCPNCEPGARKASQINAEPTKGDQ